MPPAIGYISGAMEFNREGATEANAIVACSDREVRLRDRAIAGSVIVTRESVLDDWRPPAPQSLSIDDFAKLIPLKPEVVLLGTGSRQLLPPPALYAAFAERRHRPRGHGQPRSLPYVQPAALRIPRRRRRADALTLTVVAAIASAGRAARLRGVSRNRASAAGSGRAPSWRSAGPPGLRRPLSPSRMHCARTP